MVDVFDKGTPIKSILKIKAHLEKLNFKYTYVIGGEEGINSEEWVNLVFGKRLQKLDAKEVEKMGIVVPKTQAEADYIGHNVKVV